MKIAHIINPVQVDESSDLYAAQPVTFETMRKAKAFAIMQGVEVEQFYACYDEDMAMAPESFIEAKKLQQSVQDVAEFNTSRKLPLIRDILDALYATSDAEYFIYTNVDIALMPYFYDEIRDIINQGYDGFVINRRTISKNYTSLKDLAKMYAQIGQKHPGFDCFVFKREAYSHFDLGNACIGANWIGRVLISNVMAYADKFKVFEEEHLTFHLGDDRSWKVEKFLDYDQHNERELVRILNQLLQTTSKAKTKLQQFLDYHQRSSREDNSVWQTEVLMTTDRLFRKLMEDESRLDQSPVFIVGFPRSGTTLVQSLIATQGIETFPETHFFNYILQNLAHQDGFIDVEAGEVVRCIEAKIPLNHEARQFISGFAKGTLREKTLFETIVLAQLLTENSPETVFTKRWLEKTPGHTLYIEKILNWYPRAKFIFIMRNPMHIFASWRSISGNWGQKWLPVEIYCERWLQHLNFAEEFQEAHSERILFTRLEDLVEDTLGELKRLGAFLEIEINPEDLSKRDSLLQRIVLSTETWKADVYRSLSNEVSERKNKDCLSHLDQYRVYQKLKEPLKKYHYDMGAIASVENPQVSFAGIMADLAYYDAIVWDKKCLDKLVVRQKAWSQKQDVLLKNKDEELQRRAKRMTELNGDVKTVTELLNHKKQEVEKKDTELQRRAARLVELSAEIEKVSVLLSQKTQEAEEKDKKIKLLLQAISNISNFKIVTHPFAKLKAYKNMKNTFYSLKD